MIFTILLLVVSLICLVTDLKSRKIYNVVIFPALAIAFILHGALNGVEGILFSVSGFFVGLGILLIPYLLGGMGAGDVKLLALIGALKGTAFVIVTAIYMAVLGGLIAILVLLFRKGAFERIKSIFYILSGLKQGVKLGFMINKNSLKTTYPYGVAIVGGVCLSLVLKGWIVL